MRSKYVDTIMSAVIFVRTQIDMIVGTMALRNGHFIEVSFSFNADRRKGCLDFFSQPHDAHHWTPQLLTIYYHRA